MVSIFFTFQGKTGVPGFPGNGGSPVSKPLLYIFINNSEKDTYTVYTENNNPSKGIFTNFPTAVQLNVRLTYLFCQI